MNEQSRLLAAIRNRESLLLLGHSGAGKTALLRWSMLHEPSAIYAQFRPVLHDLLVELTAALLSDQWTKQALARQTTIQLKGRFFRAIESGPRLILLDELQAAANVTYRFLQKVSYTPGTALIGAARDRASLGSLRRLFFDSRRHLNVPPLQRANAVELFRRIASRLQLQDIDLEEFQGQVLASAKGNPGRILDMCERATRQEYRWETRIKFVTLSIDNLIRFHS